MSGVAKKKDLKVDRRGELIEQNQDGLEYSSEEEVCLMTIKMIYEFTDYGRPTKPFFIEIPNFWAWADNLGR